MNKKSKTITITSFKRGTGKTNLLASIGVIAAQKNMNVLLVDSAFHSPSLHTLFDIDPSDLETTLTDCLLEKMPFKKALIQIKSGAFKGHFYLLPASPKSHYITQLMKKGYDLNLFQSNFRSIQKALNLDLILIDTQSGLNEDNLMLLAVSDVALVLMRTDQQEFQGTAVMIDLIHHLEIPEVLMLVNDLPGIYNLKEAAQEIEAKHKCKVAAVIPHASEMMTLGSSGVFALEYPTH